MRRWLAVFFRKIRFSIFFGFSVRLFLRKIIIINLAKGGFLILLNLELQDSHSPGGMMGTENRLADLCAAAELMQYREQVLDEQKVSF
jgi:hypothetical protein